MSKHVRSPLLDTNEGTLVDSSVAFLLDDSVDAISYAARARQVPPLPARCK